MPALVVPPWSSSWASNWPSFRNLTSHPMMASTDLLSSSDAFWAAAHLHERLVPRYLARMEAAAVYFLSASAALVLFAASPPASLTGPLAGRVRQQRGVADRVLHYRRRRMTSMNEYS